MLLTALRGRSLRSWIALGMTITVLPLATAAVVGYLMLNRGIIASFQDITTRQRDQIDPTQRLRLLLLDAATPLDDFMDEGDPLQPAAYRIARERVEAMFVDVHAAMRSAPELRALVERARDDWTAADRLAAEGLSVRRAPGDPHGAALMDGFHGLTAAAVDKLGVVYDDLVSDLRNDHDAVLRELEQSKRLALLAAAVSVFAIITGAILIGRVIAGSVERLVSGAELFAAGDRDHRIDVQVPPELHQVAEEFNRMIGRIRASEDALADLARRDSLTLLLNRRAFDESLVEMFARQQRFGERFALLILDLDRFKHINDTYGHGVGDDVLRTAAQAMAADLRPFDRLFRIGGEEFSVILPGNDSAAALLVAERLRQTVAAHPITVGGITIQATVSVGVAAATIGSQSATLISAADAALYRAKAAGRNQVIVSDEAGGTAP
jgi:diguanylate cyclase (GGDEF)-like protein